MERARNGSPRVCLDSYIGDRICKGKLINYNSLPSYICDKLKRIIRTATHRQLDKRFKTTSEYLKALHDFRPRQPHYLERAKRKAGRLVKAWNLVVPEEVLNRSWGEVL